MTWEEAEFNFPGCSAAWDVYWQQWDVPPPDDYINIFISVDNVLSCKYYRMNTRIILLDITPVNYFSFELVYNQTKTKWALFRSANWGLDAYIKLAKGKE